ncbi:sugar phosphate isomerase/epimerase [Paenibacillus sp. H1-7]|uniref:sugar phosphate isomerase/epimerase family protein n=1 Tax=Paenibacillus sp. H1-7 TaxID=2282849 RepID=UPI001EF84972|nr:sugar phosphate isomerase/epimerase family protein [Paenibacillus sp. H1-7]ULL15204.1 sugar phosphate isomerase/epimerase [Paenibacillus sp. H1-7]
MKLGFSTIGCPQWSVDEIVAFTKQSGYEGVEIRFVRGSVNLWEMEEFQPESLAATKAKFEQNGIDVVSIDTSVRFATDAPEEVAKQLEQVQRNVHIASALGAPYIRVFGGPIPKDQTREETLQHIIAGMNRAVELAGEHGITVLLETHDHFSTGEQVLPILDNVKGLHILWDILHSYRHGESFEETYRLIGDRIKHVHIKDASVFTPAGFDYKLIGEGTIPVAEAVQVLRRNGYSGYLNFEWEKGWHPEIEEPEIALPHYVSVMNQILSSGPDGRNDS